MKNRIRQGLKTVIYAVPGAQRYIRFARLGFLDKTMRLRCYIYDSKVDRRHIGWKRQGADYWRLSSDRAWIDHLLTFQNGNRGFGQTVPQLAIVAAEYQTFFESPERTEPLLHSTITPLSPRRPLSDVIHRHSDAYA